MKRKIITITTIAALLLGSYPTGAESIHKLTTKDQRLTTNLRPQSAGEKRQKRRLINDAEYRKVLLKDASVDKDYFELLFKANLDVLVLSKRRMRAKRAGDDEEYERILAEIRELVGGIEASIDGYGERGSRYQSVATTPDYREEAKTHLRTAVRMIARGNEQVANNALWAALSDIARDREEIMDLGRNLRRAYLKAGRRGRTYYMFMGWYEKPEGALTTMRVGGQRESDLRWQAFSSCDDQINFELVDRVVMKGYIERLDKVLAMIDEDNLEDSETECSNMLRELGTRKQVEEKRLGIIALNAARQLLSLEEPRLARDLINITRNFFAKRFENTQIIAEAIRTGRLVDMRGQAIVDNRRIINDFANPILDAVNDAPNFTRCTRLLGWATRDFMREPEFRTLMPRVWKCIYSIRSQKEPADIIREVKDTVEKLAWRVRASYAIGDFMQAFRDRLVRRTLDEVIDYRLIEKEIFHNTYQDFRTRPGLIRKYPNLFWTILYQAAFISLEIDNPLKKTERISNPAFETLDALILIKLTHDFGILTTARNFPKRYGDTTDLLKGFLAAGKRKFMALDINEKHSIHTTLIQDRELHGEDALHIAAANDRDIAMSQPISTEEVIDAAGQEMETHALSLSTI